MSDATSKLLDAISNESVEDVLRLLAEGADPNAIDTLGSSALMKACDSWHSPENRLSMVQALIQAGADPSILDSDSSGPLFACVFAKDANLIEFLVKHGADPNKEHDAGETLYDWAEFDYRFDEFDLDLPEEPTENDKKDEDAWLQFLSRLAIKYQKRQPDYLIALRRAGAKTGQEMKANPRQS
jgi:hypothetical protein